MDKLVRQVAFGLALGFGAKIGILGASWQDIAALGIISMVALVLSGVKDEYERKVIADELEELKKQHGELVEKVKLQDSSLSALKLNSGITTRRL